MHRTFRGISLVLLGVFLIAGSAHAQRGWQVGVRATPMWTNMLNGSTPDSLDTEMTFGMAGGIAGGYGFTKNMSLVANLLYSAQGQHYTYSYEDPSSTTPDGDPVVIDVREERRLRYLKFPVFFKYSTSHERKYVFSAQAGPQAEYLVSAAERDNDRRFEADPPVDPNVEVANFPSDYEKYNNWNVSAVGAVGMDIKLRFNLWMNVQARAAYGFLDSEDMDVTYQERRDGKVSTVNFHEDRRGLSEASNNLNVGITLGFTYVFIPKFHY